MLTFTSVRAGKLTVINTTQCTRAWYMHHMTFFSVVSNDTNAAKRECTLVQESTNTITLDCMKIKVIKY